MSNGINFWNENPSKTSPAIEYIVVVEVGGVMELEAAYTSITDLQASIKDFHAEYDHKDEGYANMLILEIGEKGMQAFGSITNRTES